MYTHSNFLANYMVSDQYEIYCIEDTVEEDKTQYHSHDFYEIHITLSGQGLFYLDGVYHKIDAGTILLIHHGDLHRICAQKSTYYERMYIYVTPEFLKSRSSKFTDLERCFNSKGSSKSKIIKADIVDLLDYIKVFVNTPNSKNFGEDVIYEQEIIKLLIFLNKLVMGDNFEDIVDVGHKNELITNVINFVNDNLDSDLSLDNVANKFFVSKYHLAHKFKEVTDMTFHNFVLKKRLIYAKQLLRRHKNSSNIFADCGFKSYSYFLKSFKKEYGITPKEFINLSINGNHMYFSETHTRKVKISK